MTNIPPHFNDDEEELARQTELDNQLNRIRSFYATSNADLAILSNNAFTILQKFAGITSPAITEEDEKEQAEALRTTANYIKDCYWEAYLLAVTELRNIYYQEGLPEENRIAFIHSLSQINRLSSVFEVPLVNAAGEVKMTQTQGSIVFLMLAVDTWANTFPQYRDLIEALMGSSIDTNYFAMRHINRTEANTLFQKVFNNIAEQNSRDYAIDYFKSFLEFYNQSSELVGVLSKPYANDFFANLLVSYSTGIELMIQKLERAGS